MLPLLACTLTAGVMNAQAVTEYERELDAFSRVEISGAFQVEMEEGSDCSVSIAVDDLLQNYVQAYVEGGVLRIYLDEKKLSPEVRRHYRSRGATDPVMKARISTPASVRSLTLNGKSVLEEVTGNVFAPDSARFFLYDDARIEKLALDASDAVQLRLDRRSSAILSAKCSSLVLELSGSSKAEVQSESKDCSAWLSANASCVWNGTSEAMKVNARGTSRSIFNGESASAEYTVAGSADVNAENLKVVDAKVEMTGFCTLTESASGSLFVNISNGSKLTYKNSPVFFINSVKNSSISRYYDEPQEAVNDGDRRTL